jgi:hypothetical protein
MLQRIRYNTGQGIVKIRIEDDSGAVIDNWTVMLRDLPETMDIIFKKYGLKIRSKVTSDLDWIK